MSTENQNATPLRTIAELGKKGIGRAFPAERRGQVHAADRLPRLKRLADLMDAAFRIPGTQRKIGLDSLIGLIPGVGDLATTTVSLYIIREAWLLGLPKRKLAKMTWNVAVDAVVGAVPLFGDLFDFAFKSNSKNVALIAKHFGYDSQTIDGEVVSRAT